MSLLPERFSTYLGMLCLPLLPAAAPWAAGVADEAWLNGEEEALTAAVNEGELVFLARQPDRPVHHHSNRIELSLDSLESGWADIRQCHRHLDVTGRVEIVFNAQRSRELRIADVQGVGRAWVEGHTVQLDEVMPAASLCLELQSKVVHRGTDGQISVRNGPFMRRFLDGFYPMRVELDITYPCERVSWVAIQPPPQPGLSVLDHDCRVSVDAWFEGRLYTDLLFQYRD